LYDTNKNNMPFSTVATAASRAFMGSASPPPAAADAAVTQGQDKDDDGTASVASGTSVRGAGVTPVMSDEQFQDFVAAMVAKVAQAHAQACPQPATASAPVSDVQMAATLRGFLAENPIAAKSRAVNKTVDTLYDQQKEPGTTRARMLTQQVLMGRFDPVNGITLVHRWFSPPEDLKVWLDAITTLPFREALRVHNVMVYRGIRETFRLGADGVPFLLLPLFPAKALEHGPEALAWNYEVMTSAAALELSIGDKQESAAVSGGGLDAERALAARFPFADIVKQQADPLQLEGAGYKQAPMTVEEAEHAAKNAQSPEALRALVARLVADLKRSGRAPRAGGFGPKDGKAAQQGAPKTDKSGN
jgi:hypothetical protein